MLQRRDSNFNVFVGQVGYWLPWDPQAHQIENQEYLEFPKVQKMTPQKLNPLGPVHLLSPYLVEFFTNKASIDNKQISSKL